MIDDMITLIMSNEKIIYSVINKYKNYGDLEDLYQVGMMGMVKAYHNYKKDRDCKFSSYAYFYVVGEVNTYLRDNNIFKISKNEARLFRKINEAKTLLSQKLNKEVSDLEVASFLEIPLEEIIKINECFTKSLLLEEQGSYLSTLEDPMIMDLRMEFNKLDLVSKRIIKGRYEEGKTQKEVSKELGLTQVMVSRKEKGILERLRVNLR